MAKVTYSGGSLKSGSQTSPASSGSSTSSGGGGGRTKLDIQIAERKAAQSQAQQQSIQRVSESRKPSTEEVGREIKSLIEIKRAAGYTPSQAAVTSREEREAAIFRAKLKPEPQMAKLPTLKGSPVIGREVPAGTYLGKDVYVGTKADVEAARQSYVEGLLAGKSAEEARLASIAASMSAQKERMGGVSDEGLIMGSKEVYGEVRSFGGGLSQIGAIPIKKRLAIGDLLYTPVPEKKLYSPLIQEKLYTEVPTEKLYSELVRLPSKVDIDLGFLQQSGVTPAVFPFSVTQQKIYGGVPPSEETQRQIRIGIGKELEAQPYTTYLLADESSRIAELNKKINQFNKQPIFTGDVSGDIIRQRLELKRAEAANRLKQNYPDINPNIVLSNVGSKYEGETSQGNIAKQLVERESVSQKATYLSTQIEQLNKLSQELDIRGQNLESGYEAVTKFVKQNPDKPEEAEKFIDVYNKEFEKYQKDASIYERESQLLKIPIQQIQGLTPEQIQAKLERSEEQQLALRRIFLPSKEKELKLFRESMEQKYGKNAIQTLIKGETGKFVYEPKGLSPEDAQKLVSLQADIQQYTDPRLLAIETRPRKWYDILGPQERYQREKISEKFLEPVEEGVRRIENPYLRGITQFGTAAAFDVLRKPEKYAGILMAATPLGAGLTGAEQLGLMTLGRTAAARAAVKGSFKLGLGVLAVGTAIPVITESLASKYPAEAFGREAPVFAAFGKGYQKGAKFVLEPKEIKTLRMEMRYKTGKQMTEYDIGEELQISGKDRKSLLPGEIPRAEQRKADFIINTVQEVTPRFGRKYNINVETKIKPDNTIVKIEKIDGTIIVTRQKPTADVAVRKVYENNKLKSTKNVDKLDYSNVAEFVEVIKAEDKPYREYINPQTRQPPRLLTS